MAIQCPECGSSKLRKEGENHNSDGYGIDSEDEYYYRCEECDCKFTEIIKHTREIVVDEKEATKK